MPQYNQVFYPHYWLNTNTALLCSKLMRRGSASMFNVLTVWMSAKSGACWSRLLERYNTPATKPFSQMIQVLNSAGNLEYSCCIPLWSLNEEEDDILLSISAKLFHVKLLMVIVGAIVMCFGNLSWSFKFPACLYLQLI